VSISNKYYLKKTLQTAVYKRSSKAIATDLCSQPIELLIFLCL